MHVFTQYHCIGIQHLYRLQHGLKTGGMEATCFGVLVSSKAKYCVRLFGIFTSEAGILFRTSYVAYSRYHALP